MGVDVSHIIRHNFYEVEDKEKSFEFTKATIQRLKENLLIQEDLDVFNINQSQWKDEPIETEFLLPLYNITFVLHNGFWQIETMCDYEEIAMHDGDYFPLRRLIFDIARALGQEEAWYAEEYYTWNGGGCEESNATFEEWLERSVSSYGKEIPEFNQEDILKYDVSELKVEPIYHDSFRECKEEYKKLQDRLGDYQLLNLYLTGNGYLRCKKNGSLFLIHSETFRPMFNESVDNISQTLNGPEFIVKKNELYAVYDEEGNQLTDFVKGQFHWKWAPINEQKPSELLRIIYNEEANIELAPR